MYEIFFDEILFPVAPSSIEQKISNQNNTLELVGLGQINQLKTPGLLEISFELMLPHKPYPFAIYKGGFKSQEYFLKVLEYYKIKAKPFKFIVSRESDYKGHIRNLPITVSLESYSIVEDAGNGKDIVVKIELKEYKGYSTGKGSGIGKGMPAEDISSKKEEASKGYKVVAGDTLWAICKKHLGDGNAYKKVAQLNKIPNPNVIYPGQVIRFE